MIHLQQYFGRYVFPKFWTCDVLAIISRAQFSFPVMFTNIGYVKLMPFANLMRHLQDYVATRWYRAPELCGSFFSKV